TLRHPQHRQQVGQRHIRVHIPASARVERRDQAQRVRLRAPESLARGAASAHTGRRSALAARRRASR
ncbi:MAG: hypothetical protein RMJ55_20265, partial [Roseiflexaceae bacterium]|nr:hypothetical protein [Roseiflexaceae bacterium]